MALNFPNNPQTGDTYLAPNNQLYLYDGEKWIGFVTPAGTIAQGITFVGDDSTGTRVSDGESFKIAGAGSVTTAVSGDTITITGSASAQGITFVGDDSSGTRVSDGESFKIAGTQNITTAVSGDTLTITGPDLSSYLTSVPSTIEVSELVGITVPAVGGTASANETGITYSNKIAIFTEGAFTVGVWTDVQIGWTVTDNNGFTDTIASRGGFGAASFVTTVNNWPAPASGKTYVFTSPDYQPASVDPVEITVGNNDWTFDNNGGLTLPTGVTNNGRIINDNGISLKVDSSYWTFGTDGSITFPDSTTQNTAGRFIMVGDDSTGTTFNAGETIRIAGAQNITTAVSGDTLTITGPDLSVYATQSYVDSASQGLDVKNSVKLATTAELTNEDASPPTYDNGTAGVGATLTFEPAILFIDGVGGLQNGDRILIKDQSNQATNGIYVRTSGTVYTRAVDADSASELTGGTFVFVEQGTVNGDSGFVFTHNGTPTVGTTALTVSQFSGAGQITAGAGLEKSGNTLSIADGGITNSKLQNSGIIVVDDTSTASTISLGETLKIAGGTGITTAVSGDTLTITGSKNIDVNEISSGDSSAIQINDAVNISGAVTANAGLTVTGAINGLGNSKLDFTTLGANTAYLTTTSDDTTALVMFTTTAELYAQTNILIKTNTGGTAKVWTFGDDGGLTFPDSTTQNTAASITIVGDDSTGVTLNAGETIKIAGAGSITTAVSGDTITITGTGGGASIGDLTVDGTTISSGSSSKITLNESVDITGTLQVNDINSADSSAIQINDSLNASGTITATTFVTHGTGGSITGVNTLQVNEISSADSTAIQINDSVNISGTLNAKTLITNTISSEDSTAIQVNDGLRISGDLTFSNNTVQTTAYVTASGNWTVTTGTNTYSFTVPVDGTYTMWVKGNIANGIIIWNATVSVSNSNVAAIGYQYAWNYTGGGSPIALTAIPDQIRGSAGTISTDATYAGTTSNRFDFGISNTSGSSQTIYYGYAKIS